MNEPNAEHTVAAVRNDMNSGQNEEIPQNDCSPIERAKPKPPLGDDHDRRRRREMM
jgi:hypothetical protein